MNASQYVRKDVISIESAQTLDGLFSERVTRSPQKLAYRDYDTVTEQWRDYSWADMARSVARWQAALAREELSPGDRVAIMCRNCPQWVAFEQASLGLGLVVVPLYTEDRAENAAYCIENAGVKLLVVEKTTQWEAFLPIQSQLNSVLRIVILLAPEDGAAGLHYDQRVVSLNQWLPEQGGQMLHINTNPDALATIIYTSGTTGRPKGVMLSHDNILSNTFASTQAVDVM